MSGDGSSAGLDTGLAPRPVHGPTTASSNINSAPTSSPASREYKFDCFLSHKRSDCKDLLIVLQYFKLEKYNSFSFDCRFSTILGHDICLRVSDNLKHRGLVPFIDRECLDNLDELGKHVCESRVLFLFLTNNIFKSPWCMMEVVTAHEAGNLLVPIYVEGASWGEHGARRFPDINQDVPEVMTPTEGMTIRPRPAIQAMFDQVSVDLSRTYFDAFMDNLEQRTRKHLPGVKMAVQARMSIKPDYPGAGPPARVGASVGASMFWSESFGEKESVAWEEFEQRLRNAMVATASGWEAALPIIKSAIESNGAVSAGTFRATFSTSESTFADTLKAMGESVESKEEIFDIVLRDAESKTVDDRLDPTFIMVKVSVTLTTVRNAIIDCFQEEDEDEFSNIGLDFFFEGDFAFVFKNGEKWTKVRRSQEKALKLSDLRDLSIIPDTKARKKMVTADTETFKSEDVSAAEKPSAHFSQATSNSSQNAAAEIIGQARTRRMENMTTGDVLSDPAMATQFNSMLTQVGGNEDTTTLVSLLTALQQNPNSLLAKQNLVQQFLSEDATNFQAAGLDGNSKANLSTVLNAGDQESMTKTIQKEKVKTEKELAERLADFKNQMLSGGHGRSKTSGSQMTVVIIGGGAGGGLAALALDRNPKIHTVLIDTKEYFEETPAVLRMMVEEEYEYFDAAHIEHKEYIVNGEVVVGRVTTVSDNYVCVGKNQIIRFDYLIVATGTRYPSEIKTSNTSLEFRRRQMKTERQRIQAANKIVMIGGGLVGTELAGEIRSYFPEKDIQLVTRNEKLLPRMEGAHELAVSVLTQEPGAVKIRSGEQVSFELDVNENCFETSLGEAIQLEGSRVYNCTGYKPNNEMLPKEWLDERGFLACGPTMIVDAVADGRANIFAVGDICCDKRFLNGERLSAAAAAHAMAAYRNIEALIESGWNYDSGVARPKLTTVNLSKGAPSNMPSALISLGNEKMISVSSQCAISILLFLNLFLVLNRPPFTSFCRKVL